jgi:hypothetical protein
LPIHAGWFTALWVRLGWNYSSAQIAGRKKVMPVLNRSVVRRILSAQVLLPTEIPRGNHAKGLFPYLSAGCGLSVFPGKTGKNKVFCLLSEDGPG